MNSQFLIAACAAAALSGPVSASVAAPMPRPTSMADIAPARRICIVDTITGSRVPVKVCHTREDWQKMGIDPLARQ